MTASTTITALALVWVGALSFGALVVLRDRRRLAAAKADGGRPPTARARRVLETTCIFAGSLGMIAGLGVLAVGMLR